MERPRIAGYDCYTGEHIDREMTDEEYAQYEALIADHQPLPDPE
jgi:hypothetical protein